MATEIPRAEVVPQPGAQLAFQWDGRERLRYHFGAEQPQAYFYPVVGPAGRPVTRLGHPHDPYTHRHHLGLWVGHRDVDSVNFWEHGHAARIAHERVVALQDGEQAAATLRARWLAEERRELLLDERVWTFIPLYESMGKGRLGEFFLDLKLTLAAAGPPVTVGKTPFGFAAVRVAKWMGARDGGGRITNSEGRLDEAGVHWQRARWCDYSGPAAPGGVVNGITLMDHPLNLRHPTTFHARDDGWMGAALTYGEPLRIVREQPLVLRYRFWIHDGPCSAMETEAHWNRWSHTA
jgi:hypothetical protein